MFVWCQLDVKLAKIRQQQSCKPKWHHLFFTVKTSKEKHHEHHQRRVLLKSARPLLIIIPSVASAVVVLISVGVMVYRLRVKLFTRFKFHPFDRDECLIEDMIYDVFLSCSSDNNLPRGNRIREQLEQCGYRVCYPPRDFLAGELIQNNVYNAVVSSKRTVCFLTEQFIQRFVSLSVVCRLFFNSVRILCSTSSPKCSKIHGRSKTIGAHALN